MAEVKKINVHHLKLIEMNCKLIANNLFNEMIQIENRFKSEIATIQAIKFVILAESPISFSQYFYLKPSGFLTGIKNHYKVQQKQLINTLRRNGIIILDIYKFPLSPDFYSEDKHNLLYDDLFVQERLKLINNKLDTQAYFVFRYKRLIKKALYQQPALIKLNYIKDQNKNHCPLFDQERPKHIINPIVMKCLP